MTADKPETQYRRWYRATLIGRQKTRIGNRAARYALQQLKRAHLKEYERYRQAYLAEHPYPRGVGSGNRLPRREDQEMSFS
jgi:hypothetical protein